MKTIMALSIVATVIFISGCESDVSSGGSSGDVVEYRLNDGVRCAVLLGSYKGGIDCDWGRLSTPQNNTQTSTHNFYKEE